MANKPEEAMSIKGLFQGLVPDPGGVVQGIVKGVSPLSIQVMNDEKLTLNENSLVIPRHLTDYTTTVDISGGTVSGSTASDGSHTHSYSGTSTKGGDPEHNHGISGETGGANHSHSLSSLSIRGAKMTVHNALKVGETVHLLSFDSGKQYYVLDRVV